MDDRTPCLNPSCRRTFKREHEDETIVCGKCWKLLPMPVRQRYKQLRRRMKLIKRMDAKGPDFRRRGRKHGAPDRGAPQAFTMGAKFDRLWDRHWDWIRAFYLTPEKPAGLDSFLEEIGL
ncbi:hypothetical protein [Mesorhizobium sp.]|uniref:hypothetical protein n=1 Tax=Mesorhizobium sp. TaxID=1871066 RepID=UPI000FE5D73D|nr:hypothetical protein [Mesorhizobium sp.]RWH31598.1 MAG: hypothetical protein EOQ76_07220 [Mesorhizobium sp.]TIR57651.1 MAG: hypothetical protein E5X22_22770 [Mesorhizobium sp.]